MLSAFTLTKMNPSKIIILALFPHVLSIKHAIFCVEFSVTIFEIRCELQQASPQKTTNLHACSDIMYNKYTTNKTHCSEGVTSFI